MGGRKEVEGNMRGEVVEKEEGRKGDRGERGK